MTIEACFTLDVTLAHYATFNPVRTGFYEPSWCCKAAICGAAWQEPLHQTDSTGVLALESSLGCMPTASRLSPNSNRKDLACSGTEIERTYSRQAQGGKSQEYPRIGPYKQGTVKPRVAMLLDISAPLTCSHARRMQPCGGRPPSYPAEWSPAPHMWACQHTCWRLRMSMRMRRMTRA